MDSALAFLGALDLPTMHIASLPAERDPLLRFHRLCTAYLAYKDEADAALVRPWMLGVGCGPVGALNRSEVLRSQRLASAGSTEPLLEIDEVRSHQHSMQQVYLEQACSQQAVSWEQGTELRS